MRHPGGKSHIPVLWINFFALHSQNFAQKEIIPFLRVKNTSYTLFKKVTPIVWIGKLLLLPLWSGVFSKLKANLFNFYSPTFRKYTQNIFIKFPPPSFCMNLRARANGALLCYMGPEFLGSGGRENLSKKWHTWHLFLPDQISVECY